MGVDFNVYIGPCVQIKIDRDNIYSDIGEFCEEIKERLFPVDGNNDEEYVYLLPNFSDMTPRECTFSRFNNNDVHIIRDSTVEDEKFYFHNHIREHLAMITDKYHFDWLIIWAIIPYYS